MADNPHFTPQRQPDDPDAALRHRRSSALLAPPAPCPKVPIRGYSRVMNNLSKILPPDLESWIETRVAGGAYSDSADYLRQLVRKDRDEAEDTAWVREKIAEGEASGFIDRDAREVLREIVAERHARRG